MKKVIKVAGILTMLSIMVLPLVASAQANLWGNVPPEEVAEEIGVSGETPLQTTIARIINVALGLLGIVAVVIILIGGFKWMTSGGSEEKVGEAKKLLMAGVIGLIIILAAYAIATFVINALVNATA